MEVKDSSIWQNPSHFSAGNKKDSAINVGVIREIYYDKDNDDVSYLVDVNINNTLIPLTCTNISRFGGVFNYEEYTLTTFSAKEGKDNYIPYTNKAGDLVIVSTLGGRGREGVILGGFKHPARKSNTYKDVKTGDSKPQYASEFNGIETLINKDGEYTLTYKGIPTNISNLRQGANPNIKPPAPVYDSKITNSFFKFDKMGNIIISTGEKEDPSTLTFDKSKKNLTLLVGKVSLTIDQKEEAISLMSKAIKIENKEKISIKVKDLNIEASNEIKIKANKIAIGSSGTELLAKISELIEAIGSLTIITPMGPASPIQASPTWAQVAMVKSAIDSLKTSL